MKVVEWKKLPRSIRFENAEVICDVWPFMSNIKQYTYTVFDKNTGCYTGSGSEFTEDLACQKALEIAKI